MWLVLLNLKTRRPATQRQLAEDVGVGEATLTHHLNAMDAEGLITRRRDTANRRIHVVELTAAGEETFLRLRGVAMTFDRRLVAGITKDELAGLEGVLDRLVQNIGFDGESVRWTGLMESRDHAGGRSRRRAADALFVDLKRRRFFGWPTVLGVTGIGPSGLEEASR